jgi:hypothetical protein
MCLEPVKSEEHRSHIYLAIEQRRADSSDRTVNTRGLEPLEHWDHEFEYLLGCGCFHVVLSCVGRGLKMGRFPSKESNQISKSQLVLKLRVILKPGRSQGRIHVGRRITKQLNNFSISGGPCHGAGGWSFTSHSRRPASRSWSCRGQGSTGTGFTPSPSVFPVSFIPSLFHILSCIMWGMDGGSVRDPVPQRFISPHRNISRGCKSRRHAFTRK